MNKQELVKKIDVFLSALIPQKEDAEVVDNKTEVTLAEYTLDDGVIVQYTVIAPEDLINILSDDGTLTPLTTGEYIIDGFTVKVEDGVMKEVVEIAPEEPTEEATEEPTKESQAQELSKEIKLAEEKFDAKLIEKQSEMQADFEIKLAKEKDNFKTQLEELSNEIKLSNIIQAPVEKVTKKVIYTVKDKMMMDIKRNNKQE